MKILIVEDEAKMARYLASKVTLILEDTPCSITIVDDYYKAKNEIQKQSWNILFLDLNINGEDGMDLLKNVTAESFHTIIISASVERAIEAFNYEVLDFIGKPFTEERLRKAIDRYFSHRHQTKDLKYLTIKTGNKFHLVPLHKITHIQGNGNYSNIHTVDGDEFLHGKSLDKLIQLLPEAFVRIHKSYIVNLVHSTSIRNLPGSQYRLILTNQQEIPIGRTRVNALRERISG